MHTQHRWCILTTHMRDIKFCALLFLLPFKLCNYISFLLMLFLPHPPPSFARRRSVTLCLCACGVMLHWKSTMAIIIKCCVLFPLLFLFFVLVFFFIIIICLEVVACRVYLYFRFSPVISSFRFRFYLLFVVYFHPLFFLLFLSFFRVSFVLHFYVNFFRVFKTRYVSSVEWNVCTEDIKSLKLGKLHFFV